MNWGDGDNWTLEVDIPGGSYDFKFVVQREGAFADDSDWEAGANRSLFVSPFHMSRAGWHAMVRACMHDPYAHMHAGGC
jgi:hypothetical protein